MNLFETQELPNCWTKSIEGSINPLLEEEPALYHKYAKNPDTGSNFRRFYSHIEPLHSYLAKMVFKELEQNLENKVSPFKDRLETTFKGLRLRSFFDKCSKIIVLKGTIDLAHGQILQKQIRSLDQGDIDKLGLILIDYPYFMANKALSDLNVRVLALGGVKTLKDRYSLISLGISNPSESYSRKEIIWWGIPFGMIFTYQLANNMLTNSTYADSSKHLKRSYLGVKHHHSYSRVYLDQIYTSTSLLSGFGELHQPIVTFSSPSFYDHNILCGKTSKLSQNDLALSEKLGKIKSKGAQMISSVSRLDKTHNQFYIETILDILHNVSGSVFVLFGQDKTLPFKYKKLIDYLGSERIVYAGWTTPGAMPRLIGMLDLFLDPFPFGAGMSFVSAAYQEIPIVSTKDFVNTSPSSISILYEYYINNKSLFDDEILLANLFGSSKQIAARAVNMLKGSQPSCSSTLKSLVNKVFIDVPSTVLSSK